MKLISRTEEMLLLAVCRLQDEAVALQIRQEVERISGKRFSVGGIYVPLARLVRKGMLQTESIATKADRMGRPRRRFSITTKGLAMLKEAHAMQRAMWADLPDGFITRLELG